MKKIKQILIMGLLMLTALSNAQVKIGDNATTVDPNAVLELESNGKGMLLPRLTTAQRDAIGTNVTNGMLIFNTDKNCSEVFIGVGSNGADSMGWKNMCSANVAAVFTGGTLSCAGTLSGDYYATVEMGSTNTKIITVTVTGAGDYSAKTDEMNGVSFSAEGTIQTTGVATQIKLTATGVPDNSGTFTYTVTLSGQTCTFSVTYGAAPAEILNGTIDCLSGTPATGTYSTDNVMVTNVHRKAIQVTPAATGFYKFSTAVVNGISFSISGNFTAGQVNNAQTLNLQATGTPLKTGTFTYTVTGAGVEGTCTFTVTVIGKDYLLANLSATTIASMSSGKDITFSAVTTRSNGVSVSSANITLKAGKTYLLEAQMGGVMSTNTAWINFAFVNSSNTQLPNSTTGQMVANSGSYSNVSLHQNAMAVVTVGTADMVVKLRITGSSGSATLHKDRSYLIAREISSTAGYVFAKGSSGQTGIGNGADISFAQLQNSGASVSGATFTLKAGKTYILRANVMGVFSGTGAVSVLRWVNSANTELTGNSQQTVRPVNSTSSASASGDAVAVVTVGGSDMTVKLRTMSAGSGTIDIYQNTYAFIEEVVSASDYVGARLGGAPQGVTDYTNITLTNVQNRGASVSGSTLTLKAGKTYLLNAQVYGVGASSSESLVVNWETTGNVTLGSNVAVAHMLNNATVYTAGSCSLFYIYKVGTADVDVRLQGNVLTAGTPDVYATANFMTALEL